LVILRLSIAGGLLVLMAPLLGSSSHAQPAVSTSYASTLSDVRIDVVDGGKVVVSLQASGDLTGLLTLNLQPGPDGAFAGEWAFMVAHVDTTDPETGLEPEDDGHTHATGNAPAAGEELHAHPHRDFVRLVHRGSLSGPIAGATLLFDASGKLADVSAPLSINQATLEFSGVQGTGSATLAGLRLVF
jgi:hypothetical protein